MKMNTNERITSIRLIHQIIKHPEYSKQIGLSCQETKKKGGNTCSDKMIGTIRKGRQ